MLQKSALTIFSLFFALNLSFGQETEEKPNTNKEFRTAAKIAEDGNYAKAITDFKKILETEPNDIDALYNIGYCYLNSSQPDSAIYFFNKSRSLLTEEELSSEFAITMQMFVGKAYQFLYQHDEAIKIYEDLLNTVTVNDDFMNEIIHREIEVCENAMHLMTKPTELKVYNLGPKINSEYDDHSPLISAEEDKMFFTSRKESKDNVKLPDGQYEERMYVAKDSVGYWVETKLFTELFKTEGHESAVHLSQDGQELYIFRRDIDGANIYVSNFDGKKWTEPKKLPSTINSRWDETHVSLSADKSVIYFTSNRDGGYGGLDIYRSRRLPNGDWGPAQNLGKEINTEYDEETPAIHPDGKTLFFSSEGHNSIGQFDIFYSKAQSDSSWTAPINMGYPINTPEDDMFFAPTTSPNLAYFASSSFEENYGGSDIYLIEYKDPIETWMVVFKGQINVDDENLLSNVRITATRKRDNGIVGRYRPNVLTGKYVLILESDEEYRIDISGDGIEDAKFEIVATRHMTYKKSKKANKLDDIQLIPSAPPAIEKPTETPATIIGETSDRTHDRTNQYPNLFYDENGKPFHTVQILSLRKPVSSYDVFVGLEKDKITEFKCKNGWYKYAYGSFKNHKAAKKGKAKVLDTNKWQDCFVRKTEHYQKMVNKEDLPK